ncbi:MAG: apolipoprotein N-acyltransferase [Candidatus Omnitrophica bacterium]|nr:apolipoprotein N-acyltransferase [Candidatus Omnitrophota bacterium]
MPRKLNRFFDILFSLLSGTLLAFSFNNPKLWIFSWFAFIPLFLSLNNKTLKQSFLLSLFTGITFWAGSIFWLVNVTLIGTILLSLYLALYFAAFGLIVRPHTRHSQFYVFLFVPASWVLLEYIRSHLLTGFPWSLLGYSQYLNLPVIQIADITGVWGVSFLIMFTNVAGVEIIHSLKARLIRRLKAVIILVILVFSSVLAYGHFRLGVSDGVKKTGQIRIALIQGNIPQELKWEQDSREFIMERYFNLTSLALKDTPDLIVWPEAALPVVLEEEPIYYERLLSYSNTISRPLLFGAVTYRDNLYYNSALLLSKEGKLSDRYDKLHLVPFGEYIPLRKALPFLETVAPIGDIARGKEYTIFKVRNKFGVLVCFEDVFPELSRRFVKEGADFLVNITNDAWFGKTTEASQHLAASVFRAIENRVNLVRCANTGISGFISPQGKILSLVSDPSGNHIFIPGYLTRDIYLYTQRTLYGYSGDFLIILCALYIIFILLRDRIKPARVKRKKD